MESSTASATAPAAASATASQVSGLRVVRRSIGPEALPLLVVDDFHPAPEALVARAAQEHFTPLQGDFYPGLRQPLPEDYVHWLEHALVEVFELTQAPDIGLKVFSLATALPEKLLPIQRIPHVDSTDSHQWAMVHYLCGEAFGGTSFYRHRKTGLAQIQQRDAGRYMQSLKDQATTEGLPEAAYIDGDTALFEQIYSVDARFNRAIFYPANLLHSGNLHGSALSNAPDSGRLTANACIDL